MRAIVWVLLGMLVPGLLFISVLAFIGLIRRIQMARTRRELERRGFVVRLPYAPETRPIWPRLVGGFTGLVALIITASVLTAAPSSRMDASGAGSLIRGGPTGDTVVPPGKDPGDEHAASRHPTASPGFTSPRASASSASPAADAGSDAGAPSAVTALPTSATAIRLDWAPVSGAASYDIERSIDTVAWDAVASTDSGQTQYTDVALSSGTTYYYRVVALVDGQDVSRSDVVSATTTGDTSTAPVLISATGSTTSIELEWGDVHGELGYRIERSPDGMGWTGIGSTGEGVTSYTDTGLASATTFYYRVVAVTSDGESPPSTALSATTDPDGRSTSEPNANPVPSPEGS